MGNWEWEVWNWEWGSESGVCFEANTSPSGLPFNVVMGRGCCPSSISFQRHVERPTLNRSSFKGRFVLVERIPCSEGDVLIWEQYEMEIKGQE